jgi:hypothetical protein
MKVRRSSFEGREGSFFPCLAIKIMNPNMGVTLK